VDDASLPPVLPPDLAPGSATRGRRRALAAVAAVAVLVAVGVGIAVATTSDSHHHTSATGTTRSTVSSPAPRPSDLRDSSIAPSGVPSSVAPRGAGATTTPRSPGNTSARTTPTTRRSGSLVTTPGRSVGPTTTDLPPTITQAYVQGYDDECHTLWAQAGPSGKLWDADSLDDPPHTIDECLAGLDPSNAEEWSQYTVTDARTGGQSDADTVCEGMTEGNRFQTASGLVIDIP